MAATFWWPLQRSPRNSSACIARMGLRHFGTPPSPYVESSCLAEQHWRGTLCFKAPDADACGRSTEPGRRVCGLLSLAVSSYSYESHESKRREEDRSKRLVLEKMRYIGNTPVFR